jgi:hypothetical protein
MDTVWFAFSVAYALAEGAAEVLEVPSVDLRRQLPIVINWRCPQSFSMTTYPVEQGWWRDSKARTY